MGSSGLVCSGSFTPTCSLPPSSAAAALSNTWRDVLEPHLLFFSALVICKISYMHPHSGVTTWLNVSQLLSGKWPRSLLPGVTQHKQTPLVQFSDVSMQWILFLPFQSTTAEPDGNKHVFSKLGLREGFTKWLLRFPQIRRQFGRNRKVIIKRQLSGSVISSQPRLQLASSEF